MRDESVGEHVESAEHLLELRKEGFTMALYVAVCLLAVFIALPESGASGNAARLVWGVTVGLAIVHIFAFSISARLVGSGEIRPVDVKSSGAQLAGAAFVALLASIPLIFLPADVEVEVVEVVLCGFVAISGYAVARAGDASRPKAVAYALVVLVVAVALAVLKNSISGH